MGAALTLLVDTQVLLWWMSGDARLRIAPRTALADVDSQIWISSASRFEIATRAAIGKLSLPAPPVVIVGRVVSSLAAHELPVSIRHGREVANLPLHHRDPFDRLPVAQAIVGGLVLLTQDAAQRAYATSTIG